MNRREQNLSLLAQRVFNNPVAIHPGKAEVIVAALGQKFGVSNLMFPGATRAAVDEDADFTASGLMVHGIRQVRGYQGNAIRYYQDLIAEEDPQEQMARLPNARLWQILNVNFFLTNVAQPPLPTTRQGSGQ